MRCLHVPANRRTSRIRFFEPTMHNLKLAFIKRSSLRTISL